MPDTPPSKCKFNKWKMSHKPPTCPRRGRSAGARQQPHSSCSPAARTVDGATHRAGTRTRAGRSAGSRSPAEQSSARPSPPATLPNLALRCPDPHKTQTPLQEPRPAHHHQGGATLSPYTCKGRSGCPYAHLRQRFFLDHPWLPHTAGRQAPQAPATTNCFLDCRSHHVRDHVRHLGWCDRKRRAKGAVQAPTSPRLAKCPLYCRLYSDPKARL